MIEQPSLARSTLDRAAHLRRDAEWLADAWSRGLVLVLGPDGRALVREGVLLFVDPADAPEGERLFLGLVDGVPYFAVCAEPPAVDGADAVHLWQVGAALSATDVGVFTTALALAHWHRTHLFSPATGQATTVAEGGWVRVGADGEQLFPRTDPAIIVLIHDGVPGTEGRLLLGRNAAARATPPRYSLLAGFIEPGESAEATVAREVREEVGLAVSEVTYVASESWPFPRSLMLGFTALGDPAEPLHNDPAEIADARWFTRTQVRAIIAGEDTSVSMPSASSIAYHLINRWLTRSC